MLLKPVWRPIAMFETLPRQTTLPCACSQTCSILAQYHDEKNCRSTSYSLWILISPLRHQLLATLIDIRLVLLCLHRRHSIASQWAWCQSVALSAQGSLLQRIAVVIVRESWVCTGVALKTLVSPKWWILGIWPQASQRRARSGKHSDFEWTRQS